MKKSSLFLSLVTIIGILFFQSCKKSSDVPTVPLAAKITSSAQDSMVIFTGQTQGAAGWFWDFGDGQTSTAQSPTHIYAKGGYYLVKLTAFDTHGDKTTTEAHLTILPLTPYACLTGDYTQPGYQGKTWKLTRHHTTSGDYLANADAALSVVDGTPSPLPNGFLDTDFGMGDAYQDTYTFFYDGGYRHDVKDDGAALGGIVFQFVRNAGADIINSNGKDYGLCIAKYTPEDNATFTYVAKENFTVSSVYGANGTVTYKDVSTLDFSGTEFVGFRDYLRKVIIRKITDTSMQLVMFLAASPDYFPAATNALVLSFEVVQ